MEGKKTIYLAGSWHLRRHDLRKVASRLREMGHECSSSWLQDEVPEGYEYTGDMNTHDAQDIEGARTCKRDIRRSDILVLHSEAIGASPTSGRYHEVGYFESMIDNEIAEWGWSARLIVIVGRTENVFHKQEEILKFPTWEMFWEWLAAYTEEERLAAALAQAA